MCLALATQEKCIYTRLQAERQYLGRSVSMSETSVLWEETVEAGATWSHVMKRGTALRITDIEGGANVGAIFYNFECPAERLNLPDTLKAQHIARLTQG